MAVELLHLCVAAPKSLQVLIGDPFPIVVETPLHTHFVLKLRANIWVFFPHATPGATVHVPIYVSPCLQDSDP